MYEEVLPTLLETLVERLSSQEGLEVEFKSGKGGLPASLWPTISAFANTNGGWILLGIDHNEQTDEITIQGISNPSAMLQNFYNAIRNPQKISIAMCGANDAKVEPLGEQQLIIIRVPAAPRKMRPVYISGNAYGGTYLRRNSGDYNCTKQEVDRMMREASDLAADNVVLKHYSWADLDADTFTSYRRQFQTRDPASPWNSYDDEKFLQAIGGYRNDREAEAASITVAGLLMFGKSQAILDWRTRHLIDYRLAPEDEDGDVRWDDRLVWESNLFDGYTAIYRRLVDGLPIPFRLENGVRVNKSPVHEALQEALVNLLVHTDYSETQASLVIRSQKGYFFRNPGSSRVSEADLLTTGHSDPRNPSLVRMFRFVGLADEAGTGIPKIVRTWRAMGLFLPPIDVGTERYEFTIDLRRVHLLSEEDRTWLSSLGGGWTEAEQLALVTAKHEGDVDNPRLRKLTGLHPSDVTKVLGSLRDRELLSMDRVGRIPRYPLGSKATASIVSLVDSSGNSEVSSGGNEISSGGNEISSGGNLAHLEEIAAPARTHRRLSSSLRSKIIVQLCAYMPLSLVELSTLMGRNIDHIREVVNDLLRHGHLSYLYPEQVSHPQQKYRATQILLDQEY